MRNPVLPRAPGPIVPLFVTKLVSIGEHLLYKPQKFIKRSEPLCVSTVDVFDTPFEPGVPAISQVMQMEHKSSSHSPSLEKTRVKGVKKRLSFSWISGTLLMTSVKELVCRG